MKRRSQKENKSHESCKKKNFYECLIEIKPVCLFFFVPVIYHSYKVINLPRNYYFKLKRIRNSIHSIIV